MIRTEVYSPEGVVLESWGIEGVNFVHVRDGAEVERRPARPEELDAEQPPPATPDVVFLADQLAVLTNAVDDLILDALGRA